MQILNNTFLQPDLVCISLFSVSRYTSVYAMMQFCGIFLAPLSGRLMDRKIKYPEGAENIGIIGTKLLRDTEFYSKDS